MSTVRTKTQRISPLLRKAIATIPSKELEDLLVATYPNLLEPDRTSEILQLLEDLDNERSSKPRVSVVEIKNKGREERGLNLSSK